MKEEKRFAVLIDAENVSSKYIKYVMDEMSNYGIVTYKRIYTNWIKTSSNGWQKALSDYAFSPVQSISYTTGKNSTDSAMIIDAMDILYTETVDGFCIVSSDSDFTKLAIRLKESGMIVIGMGESKTPKSFRVSCNVFKVLNVLANEDDEKQKDKEKTKDKQENATAEKSSDKNEKNDTDKKSEEILQKENLEQKSEKTEEERAITSFTTVKDTIRKILIEREGEGENVSVGEIGNLLVKRYSEFDSRNYGFSKLSMLLKNIDFIKIVETENNTLYVKLAQTYKIDSIKDKIVQIVKENGGAIDIGRLAQSVKTKYPNFNVKDYGYSQFKKFVEKINLLAVEKNNKVKLVNMQQKIGGIEDKIVKIVKENNGSIDIGALGQQVNTKYPNFKAKDYGYSQFKKLVQSIEKLVIKNNNKVQLNDNGKLLNAGQKNQEIEERIIEIVKENDGNIDLGLLGKKLKTEYPDFKAKDYGYSQFKKLVQNIEKMIVEKDNRVKLNDKDEKCL